MLTRESGRGRGFTLIELLVVVSIIALLLAILLPSLQSAREEAKAAKCGAQLRSIGLGMFAYISENEDWIPGRNTTGINLLHAINSALQSGDVLKALRSARLPVQTFDWIGPSLAYETDLGHTRAERFQTLINFYACPNNMGLRVDTLYMLSACADQQDFLDLPDQTWHPLSYLMPAHFQYWGQTDARTDDTSGTIPINYVAAPDSWEVIVDSYKSQLTRVGDASRKIAAIEATRYLDRDGTLDFDVRFNPGTFGAFTTSGGWWSGSTALGVKPGSLNWDGMQVSAGSPSKGRNLALSYRHNTSSSNVPRTAQENTGQTNAMFFDGHVSRLDDRQSRNIEYWYPKGARVQETADGMTSVEQDFIVP